MQRARPFDPRGDLVAKFLGVAPQALGLLTQPFQFSESELLRTEHSDYSLSRDLCDVTEKQKLYCNQSLMQSRQLDFIVTRDFVTGDFVTA